MSGYSGNPDAESEHAMILSENGLYAARQRLPKTDVSSLVCHDCGEEIPLARRQAQKGCMFCISCQQYHDKHQHVKMLTRIL